MPWWCVDVVRVSPRPWFPDTQTVVGTIRALWTSEQGALNYISRMQLNGANSPGYIGVAKKSGDSVTQAGHALLPYESPLQSLHARRSNIN